MSETPETIVRFWSDAGATRWFVRQIAFDETIRTRFEAEHHAAARGDRTAWAANAEGALALLLLFDQFPRNLWRGSPHAFATDPLARQVADTAIAKAFDAAVAPDLRPFFYLPFEHSEAMADQDRGVMLCRALERDVGDAYTLRWALKHREIIRRFGRFPHRNACLGRTSTPEEQAFLDAGGFTGGQASKPRRISRPSPPS
jgi:uncharacterized protein (DUF924 family)